MTDQAPFEVVPTPGGGRGGGPILISKLRLSIPPSANSIWVHTRRGTFRSRQYKQWINRNLIGLGTVERVHGEVGLVIEVNGGHGFKQGRDLDNCAKPLVDFLRNIRMIPDDNYEIVTNIWMRYIKPESSKAKAFVHLSVYQL